jgi:hypothetical protein
MLSPTFKDIFGSLLIVTSIFDAVKYYWSAGKIIKVKTARGHSRKFLNAAIINDIVKFCYGLVILDIFIISSSILALITMGYNFYIVYKYYPYRCRGLDGFTRPNIFYYIINSLTPNRLRKRL